MLGYKNNPPNPKWPNGARLAVQFVLNYEEGGENNILHGDEASEAFLSEIVGAAPWVGKRHLSMESIYEYGSRVGVWRILDLFKKKNIPFIVILTNPTTGGVTASWGMLGDILIAEPKATIGFAGRRVIQDTVRETLPDEFQTAEYVKDHGGIDLVVERQYLNSTIGTLLNVLLKKQEAQAKQDSNVTVDKSLQAAS